MTTAHIKKIIQVVLGMLLIMVILVTGCRKDTTVIIPLKPPGITRAVSFSKDLVPLFTANCAKSGCHVGGGHTPDLEADKAYNSLMNGNFINKTAPENSIIYERLSGKLTPSMPMGAASNPSNINGLVLAWIKQGAKKN